MSASFNFHAPPSDLAPFIAGFWFARGASQAPREVVVPNGFVELIVNLGRPQWTLDHERGASRCFRGSMLAGTQRGPLLIADEGGADLVGVRFKPGGVFPWLALPLVELTDRVEDATDVRLGWVARDLEERLALAHDDRERLFRLVAALRRHRTAEHDDARVRTALTHVRRAHEDGGN